MNLTTLSPALSLLFAWALLSILMGVDFRKHSFRTNLIALVILIVLMVLNHVLRDVMGPSRYAGLILITMHIPTFLVFLKLTRYGVVKMIFMILTGLVFAAPAVLIGRAIERTSLGELTNTYLFSDPLTYITVLLIAWFFLRREFIYLLKYGDNKLFALLSAVPVLYYAYVFSIMNIDLQLMNAGVRLLPSITIFVFYFLIPYFYRILSKLKGLESIQAILNQKFVAAEDRINLLNENQKKIAIFHHDVRHRLVVMDGLLATGNIEKAREFLQSSQESLDSIAPKRLCENETVNLIGSFFMDKAQRLGIHMRINVNLPDVLSIPEPELCSLISNGLENALNATKLIPEGDRWIDFYCELKKNKLLIEIQNPYKGKILMEDGLPVTNREGHGFGCRSIQTIVDQNRGNCSFEAENEVFTFRAILPV